MLTVAIIELVVLVISAVLIVPQIILLKKQIKEQHEERRRENTINFMITWCNSVKKDTSIAEQVARKLTNEQGISLYKHESFEVTDAINTIIQGAIAMTCYLLPHHTTTENKEGEE